MSKLIEFSPDQIQLIKTQIAPKATNDELQLFLYQCRRAGLDPLTRQIYCMHRKSKGGEKMTIQTSIDGFRVIAERSGDYAGQSKPIFRYDNNGNLLSAEVTVFRFRGDVRYECATAEAFWDEYVVTSDVWENGVKTNKKTVSEMWAKMKHTMLAKVAEALALRKAYPQDLSGLYTTEEMAQVDNTTEEMAQEQPAQHALPASTSIPFTPPLTPFNKAYGDIKTLDAIISAAATSEDLKLLYHFNKDLIEQNSATKAAISAKRDHINNQGKTIITEGQYKAVCDRIRKGDKILDNAKGTYVLNAGQVEELEHLTKQRALFEDTLKIKHQNPADIATIIRECFTEADIHKLHANNAMMIDRDPELTNQINGKIRTLKTANNADPVNA